MKSTSVYRISLESDPLIYFTIDSDEVENLEVEIQEQLNKRNWYRWQVIIEPLKRSE